MADSKFSASAGYYSLNSKSDTASGNISGLGIYNINYSFQVLPRTELALGYTLFYSKTISGDMGFGPDIQVRYFPLTSPLGIKASSKDSFELSLTEKFRPFAGVGFVHRQFQSLNSSFAGFQFLGGTEMTATESYSYRVEVRHSILSGPSNSSLQQTDVLLGVLFQL